MNASRAPSVRVVTAAPRECREDHLSWALQYATWGWHVFPAHHPMNDGCSCGRPDCNSVAKHPMTQHGLKDATTDPGTIREWWTRCPLANIAIACGAKSGLVVIDIDPRNGGVESLRAFQKAFDKLEAAAIVKTGGGGHHFYFKHPGGVVKQPKKGWLYPGIDIQSDGTYVIAPPSVHASGGAYAWI